MKELILASASPRRKDILSKAGFIYKTVVSNANEVVDGRPSEVARLNATLKANEVYFRSGGKSVVLGADTVVAIDDKILGKPTNEIEAFNMLKSLSGKIHLVITGYCVKGKKEVSGSVTTKVEFNYLTDEQIKEYLAKYKPYDKAGSYGIQDGYPLVKKYEGSYLNIVGLPIEKLKPLLNEALK